MAMAVAAILELEGAPAREEAEAEAEAQAGEVDGSCRCPAYPSLRYPVFEQTALLDRVGSPGLDLPKELGRFRVDFIKDIYNIYFYQKEKNPYLKF
jgi:hypothetical protein